MNLSGGCAPTTTNDRWMCNAVTLPWAVCRSCTCLIQPVPASRSSFPFTGSCHCNCAFVPFEQSCTLKSHRDWGWLGGLGGREVKPVYWAICLVAYSVQGAPHYLEGFVWSWPGLACFLLRAGCSSSQWKVWSPLWYKRKMVSATALDMLLAAGM